LARVLLLISADFIRSDFIIDTELRLAMDRQNQGTRWSFPWFGRCTPDLHDSFVPHPATTGG
jgi:hypothetical protein